MERIELAVTGLQQALRMRSPRAEIPRIGQSDDHVPAWLQLVRQQMPFLTEALSAEHTGSLSSMTSRSRRLRGERNRLVRRLHAMGPSLSAGCLAEGGTLDELRHTLLRLVLDISHHHQRVNDLHYDESWLDVGGSE